MSAWKEHKWSIYGNAYKESSLREALSFVHILLKFMHMETHISHFHLGENIGRFESHDSPFADLLAF